MEQHHLWVPKAELEITFFLLTFHHVNLKRPDCSHAWAVNHQGTQAPCKIKSCTFSSSTLSLQASG